ncbi:MAG TPA: phosphatidylcholine/phosphatidylserine synthase [Candidatus Eisenbacteria bacterium]|jgi:CDP-diacylglycerol--serine O-phosphatidyltransferase|nr:phosphatidylcholine/phosphatidylserine synthase [Candidatus Eisenbacteria bacterium]
MSGVEQPENDLRVPRIRNPKLRRGIFLLPSLFTVGNLLCGYYASVSTLVGNSLQADPFDHASKAIGLAILFDSLDGRVARLTGTNTEFGVQFDSLADVVSFGIAPGLLAYSWGVRHLPGLDTDTGVQQIAHFGWWFCLAFVVCCAWRLARFNVQGMAPGGSKYFVGMPTPAAAGMIAAVIHAFKSPIQDWRWSVAWIFLTLGLAALMTSTIRFYSFKDLPWTRKQPSLAIVFIALLGAAIWRWSEEVLLLIAGSYTAIGVTLHVVRLLRHRLVSRTA